MSAVYAALAETVDTSPDEIAMTFEGRSLTFREFLAHVDNTARHFSRDGVRRGSAVAMYGRNSPEIMFGYYAAAKLGLVFVPVNPALTAGEAEYTLKHSEAVKLYFDDTVAEAAAAAAPADLLIAMSELEEWIAPEENEQAAQVENDDPFLIIYTSGTTGSPKAVVLTHGAQADAADALARMWGITPADTVLVALPLGFLYGLSTACAVALQSGAKVVLLPRFRPQDVLEGFVSHSATVFQGVPTMFSMMLEYCEQRDLNFDLSSMRVLVSAGAPLAQELRRRFADHFGKSIENYYALTEVAPVFGIYHDDPRPVPAEAIGRAAPMADIRIVKPNGDICADGEEGEILVRGAATLKCYYKDEELSSKVMSGHYFRSGDLGYRDAEGFYYISGRIKDIIIRGGANIAPPEVETALMAHPAVQEASVFGVEDRIFGEVPVAAVILRHGRSVSAEELIEHCRNLLAGFKAPVGIRFETEFPLGKTGKVDKAALKARWIA